VQAESGGREDEAVDADGAEARRSVVLKDGTRPRGGEGEGLAREETDEVEEAG
jgi:hypothetical protein